MSTDGFTYTDSQGNLGMGNITIISPLQEDKMKAEINELNARAELFRAGVKLAAKYDKILDTMFDAVVEQMRDR